MMTDVFGAPTTIASKDALAHWNRCLQAFMAHGATTPDHLGKTLAADPHFALGHATKGLFLLLLGRRELTATARDALTAARTAAAHTAITQRETEVILALHHFLAGNPTAAIAAMERILDAHPGDTLAMKLGHAMRFVLGDGAGMRRSIERVMKHYDTGHAGRGYLLGCHAFALEETGDYDAAARAGRAALERTPDDAWGLHAVAHVFDMTGDARGGIDWLTGREAAWGHCNNFRYHVWWHKALMHLDQGEVDTVLDLYDTMIRADHTDDYRDISNATSLLSRLELEGVNVGDRWDELADISETRTEDGCLIFADLHYLLALVCGKRADSTRTLIGRICADGDAAETEIAQRMARPGLDAATGLEAFGEGDYRTAFTHLAAARNTMQLAGGSHAQRDVFERLTIDAGLRAGCLDQTETLLNARTTRRAGKDDAFAAARREMIRDGRAAARLAAE